MVSIQIM